MPTFESVAEMVAYVLEEYEPLPLEKGDRLLEKLLRLEREARLTRDPDTVILALTKKKEVTAG